MEKIQRNGISIGLSLEVRRFSLRARLIALDSETSYLAKNLAAKREEKVHRLKSMILIFPPAKFNNYQNNKNTNKKKSLPNSIRFK